MPAGTALFGAVDLIATRWVGSVTFAAFSESVAGLPERDGFVPGMKIATDFSAASLSLSHQEIRALARIVRDRSGAWGAARWAIIAPDDVVFGVSRMFAAYTAEFAIAPQVHRTLAEADAFLDLGGRLAPLIGSIEVPAEGAGD